MQVRQQGLLFCLSLPSDEKSAHTLYLDTLLDMLHTLEHAVVACMGVVAGEHQLPSLTSIPVWDVP
jgi:hypothetical protein